MPTKHLVLDRDSGLIAVADGSQPGEGLPVALSHPLVFSGIIKVHCPAGTTLSDLAAPAQTFSKQLMYSPLIRDTASAVQQLQQLYKKDGTGYIAVGGSPKLVKWMLKRRGFSVVTVNASGVALDKSPTSEFTAYLERKLTKLGSPGRYVVMDFADSGASLIKLKADVTKLRPSAEVRAVAVGKSGSFDSEKNAGLKAQIDTVLTGIDTLQKDLYEQRLKMHVLGRNKVKNEYASWSAERSKVLAGAPELGSSIKAETLSKHYQAQKAEIPKLMDLPLVEVNIDDLLDAESDGEFEAASESEDDF